MSKFVETWKGIATALGRSERWCRYMASRGDDRLPVFKVGGIVRMNLADLETWLDHQRDRAMQAPLPPPHAAPHVADLGLRLIA